MFGRLLFLSTVKELDLKGVLAYLVAYVPLTFAHNDELKISTNKPTLFSKLDVRIIKDASRNVDICIIDAIFLVPCHVDLPSTFGGVANVTSSVLVRCANRVDFACDT